jgi:radical SAM superfamily enzyme YgiQ (UPF0313 family)
MHYNLEYGITSFPFLDDHFLADKKMALEILNFIRVHEFTCRIFNLNYLHVDRDIVKALYWTGSDRVVITLDGLDEVFLRKIVRKPADFRKAKEVIQMFKEEKIVVLANIIIGYPGETPENIDWGARAMRKMGANWYSILVASPLHGSELYSIAEKNGFLPAGDEFLQTDYYTPVITTPEFTPEWIKRKAYEINLDLNFVHNFDMSHGDCRTPLKLFERVLSTVEPNHAFAYYYAAECAKHLAREAGDQPWKFLEYRDRYKEIVDQFPEWAGWAKHFELEI